MNLLYPKRKRGRERAEGRGGGREGEIEALLEFCTDAEQSQSPSPLTPGGSLGMRLDATQSPIACEKSNE